MIAGSAAGPLPALVGEEVRSWKRKYGEETGIRHVRASETPEQAENRELRKKVRELEEERTIKSERRAVIAAAEQVARQRKGPVLSWDLLEAAVGIMKGAPADAVEDSHRLYDG